MFDTFKSSSSRIILYVNSFEKLEILCLEVELLTHLREQWTEEVGGKELQKDPISVLDVFSFPITLYVIYI